MLKDEVLIGTEFTFSNKECITCTFRDINMEVNKIKKAGEMLKTYTDALKQLGKDGTKAERSVGNLWLNSVTEVTPAHQKHETSFYKAVKLCFNFYDKAKKENINWNVNFDLDPFCIELQTEPQKYDFFNTYNALLDKVLFKKARDLTLVPNPNPDEGGGGHISLDVKTAFDDNPLYLRNFIVAYENIVRDEEDDRNYILVECEDKDNAPFLHDVGELILFGQLLNKTDFSKVSIEDFVTEMQKKVYCNLTTTLQNMGEALKDAPHYQAINLEHVIDKNEAERRVELRRFNAQSDINELLRQLDVIFNILEEAHNDSLIELK